MATSKKPTPGRTGKSGATPPTVKASRKSVAAMVKTDARESVLTRTRGRVPDKLATYRLKRDFAVTPEPSGKPATAPRKARRAAKAPCFVIQKHAASRLHYDFRLEIDGTLKSWAVPKGPSTNPSEKRLAVETEDHPMAYADFEGIIPEDEYGGGTVIVWDTGTYRNLKTSAGTEVPMAKCYENGQIEIWLDGAKLRGGFALIHSRMGGRNRNWLLIKMKDEHASATRNPVARQNRSVLSGRTIAQVAREPGNVWSSH